jgi:hypothetical protein
MNRYIYALVRCVPDPRTGEFVNVGAIAGEPGTDDWSIRQVGNESRVLKLAGPADLEAVHGFLARIQMKIDRSRTLLWELETDPLDERWLQALYHDHRNVVQLSPPAPLVADDAEQALDLLFEQMIIDPVTQPRHLIVTKHRIMSAIRKSYQAANVDVSLMQPKVELHVGEHVHAQIDFAIGNGSTVQLAQGWSFQRTELQELSTQVKAWGYALLRLRDGEQARVIASDGHLSTISQDVDLEVVIAPPITSEQRSAYDEAEQVFTELDVRLLELNDADAVGRRASELLGGTSF